MECHCLTKLQPSGSAKPPLSVSALYTARVVINITYHRPTAVSIAPLVPSLTHRPTRRQKDSAVTSRVALAPALA